MRLRFRKSINLGGFRINLSKSGIGYSFGAKGLRFTHKAGGGSRTTIGIPNTGLSYVKDRPKHKIGQTSASNKQATASKREEPTIPITDDLEEQVIASSPNEMIDKLNRADRLSEIHRACGIVLPIAGLLFLCMLYAIVTNGMRIIFDTGESIDGTALVVICAILAAISLGAGLYFLLRNVKIELSYDFSEDKHFEWEYTNLMNEFTAFQTIERIWESSSDLPRDKTKISFVPLEDYVHTNLDMKVMKLVHKKILLLPDIIAVKQQDGWAGARYAEVEISFQDVPTEETSVPCDAAVLSERWLYARKDGGRNMQHQNNNYLIYNCRYGEIMLTSQSGLHVNLLCSSAEKAQNFYAALEQYINFIKE